MTLRASRKRKGEVSLSDPVGTDGEGNDITFMDILGTDQEELEEEVIRRVTLQRVRKLLEKLPPRERLVPDGWESRAPMYRGWRSMAWKCCAKRWRKERKNKGNRCCGLSVATFPGLWYNGKVCKGG